LKWTSEAPESFKPANFSLHLSFFTVCAHVALYNQFSNFTTVKSIMSHLIKNAKGSLGLRRLPHPLSNASAPNCRRGPLFSLVRPPYTLAAIPSNNELTEKVEKAPSSASADIPADSDLVEIGTILGAHGIKGEVKASLSLLLLLLLPTLPSPPHPD
jgi:hypothetical protein